MKWKRIDEIEQNRSNIKEQMKQKVNRSNRSKQIKYKGIDEMEENRSNRMTKCKNTNEKTSEQSYKNYSKIQRHWRYEPGIVQAFVTS